MHRFFLDEDLHLGKVSLTDEALVHQMRDVLRMRPGMEAVLFCGSNHIDAGWDFVLRIDDVSASSIEGELLEKVKNDREPKCVLTLYQSVLKKDNMEWIFEKGTEVGVARFVPFISARSVKTGIKYDRAKKILKEASEQSGRAIVPVCEDAVSFVDALSLAKQNTALNIFAYEKESVTHRLDALPLSSQHINLFIGPEGGFTEEEVGAAEAAGFFIASLSRRTLRAETAAITASYFLLHRFGY